MNRNGGSRDKPTKLRNCLGIRVLSMSQIPPDQAHGAASDQLDRRILDAEAAIARQRKLIALHVARQEDATSSKSLLRALQYSLKVLKRRIRSTTRRPTAANVQ